MSRTSSLGLRCGRKLDQEPGVRRNCLEHLCSENKDVFQGLGNLGSPLRPEVDEQVRPVQLALRNVPGALRTPVKEYLDDLEVRGVIVNVDRPTEWMNSVVIVRNANGKLRLCLDPKPLNKALKRCHLPMPALTKYCRSSARPRFLLKSIARIAIDR